MNITLDTNIFLNVKNKEQPFYSYSNSILEEIDKEKSELNAIISIISLTELSIGYYKNKEIIEKEEFISGLYSNKKYKIKDLNINIADKAAEIRSQISLKLPDCIIIATALIENSEVLITNDSEFEKKAESLIKIHNSQDFFNKYLK
ncbi:MAG: PIN domain-containing protein [Candidatus Lokiarchaeota archaeon]|nr:PIN domain-containing protein [Candidatus Lokiarchaeota archaeon]